MEPSTSPFGARRAMRQALAAWREQGVLGAASASTAWLRTEPRTGDWRRWLDTLLLALGAALLCAGVIVFFAFNWQDLHKFAKFGLLAGALTALAGVAWSRPAGDAAGRAALAGAQVVTGAWLAVIGQTYQTGADAWQLFALWAVLATPWALAARAAPHWWLVIVVGNVGLLRYLSVRVGVDGMFDVLFRGADDQQTVLLLLGATLLQLALWFALRAVAPALGFRGLAGSRILAVLVCGYAGFGGIGGLFDDHPQGVLLSALALLALGAWFRWRAFDIVALSLVCLTAIVLTVAGVGKVLLQGHADAGGLLLLALVTVGLAAGAASWLLRVNRQQTTEAA